MSKSKKNKVDRYQKQKVAAIPLLLLVLGYVLWSNFRGDEDKAKKLPQAQLAAKPKAGTNNTTRAPAWPNSTVDFLSGPNPFASYRVFEQIEEPALANEDEEQSPLVEIEEPLIEQVGRQLANLPVRYMFKSQGRWVMMLGDRLIKEGDEVAESIRLHKIEQGRLILKQTSPDQIPAKKYN